MIAVKIISIAVLACFCSAESEPKKSVKRGIDDYDSSPLGYNGWQSTLKLSPVHSIPIHDRSNIYAPSAHDLNHLVAAAKKAAHEVYLAQQYVNAAKEDVLFAQRLIKEKEALALIAHQKSEAAQQVLRGEAQNVVIAQQKLAKAKAYAADLQLQQAVKDSEAARAIQSSANQAHGVIQKAEQAAKLSFYKQSIKGAPIFPSYPAPWSVPSTAPWNVPSSDPWNVAPYAVKPIVHGLHPF